MRPGHDESQADARDPGSLPRGPGPQPGTWPAGGSPAGQRRRLPAGWRRTRYLASGCGRQRLPANGRTASRHRDDRGLRDEGVQGSGRPGRRGRRPGRAGFAAGGGGQVRGQVQRGAHAAAAANVPAAVRWSHPLALRVRAVTQADAPRAGGDRSRKTGKDGWCSRLAQGRGARGHRGAGPRGPAGRGGRHRQRCRGLG
jgi:hypothetical protein